MEKHFKNTKRTYKVEFRKDSMIGINPLIEDFLTQWPKYYQTNTMLYAYTKQF